MTAVKGLVLGIVVVTGVALEARGEPVRRGSWRWTSWVSGRGVFQTGLNEVPAFVGERRLSRRRLRSHSRPRTRPSPPPPPPFVAVLPLSAPEQWQSLGRFATTSPVGSALPVESAPDPVAATDAFVNFGDGPYAQADFLTNGGAQPWYTSPVVTRLFGGTPDQQQRAVFTGDVLRRVEQIYQEGGLSLSLTDDPNVRATHTVSVVAHTNNPARPDAIGIASQGSDGFTFIDQFGEAQSPDELSQALGNNIGHELMHTFGVDHHDTTGQFLDAPALTWPVLSSPATSLSAAAVVDLASRDFGRAAGVLGSVDAGHVDGQAIAPQPVPEPATLGLWAVAVSGLAWSRRLRRRADLATATRA